MRSGATVIGMGRWARASPAAETAPGKGEGRPMAGKTLPALLPRAQRMAKNRECRKAVTESRDSKLGEGRNASRFEALEQSAPPERCNAPGKLNLLPCYLMNKAIPAN
jgi:hypothetical protein